MFLVLVLMVIGITLCASVVPVITLIREITQSKKEKIVYEFSKDLFDSEYKKNQKEKCQFTGRFDTDFYDFKNHFD